MGKLEKCCPSLSWENFSRKRAQNGTIVYRSVSMDSSPKPDTLAVVAEIDKKAALVLSESPWITNVHVQDLPGCVSNVAAWNEAHAPLSLPEDMALFYSTYDGLHVTWDAVVGDGPLPLGCMHINKLEAVVPVPGPSATYPPVVTGWSPALVEAFTHRAFVVDSSCKAGLVAMVFEVASGLPSFWYLDRCRCWYKVADCFRDFTRLVVCHLGVPLWQVGVALCPSGCGSCALAFPHHTTPPPPFVEDSSCGCGWQGVEHSRCRRLCITPGVSQFGNPPHSFPPAPLTPPPPCPLSATSLRTRSVDWIQLRLIG